MRATNPEQWAYESDFDALQKFRELPTDTLRLESVFMGNRSLHVKLDGVNLRLDAINGKVRSTEKGLETHLLTHRDQKAGHAFVELIGSRVLTGLLLIIAVLGGVSTFLTIVEFIRG